MSTTKRPTGRSTKKKAEVAAPKAKAPKRAPAKPSRDDEVVVTPVKASVSAAARKPRASAASKKPPPPPIAPPQVYYDLSGAVPAEGAGLPKKVGALLGVGQKALGIKSFRTGQAQAFEHLLAGEDVLAVMPTGSGKSLLYQLTSLVLPGITVVVSPLIALIKDQIDKMVAKGVTAVRIDSTLTVKQRREVDALVRAPGGKLLLTTPERMADPEFRVFLREAASGVGVSRFVVDEAHCVSQWGHDFRPAYLSLRKALDDVGRPPVLATTATAPPHVRDDILFQLGIEKASIVTTTFDRPNLHYEVIAFDDDTEKMRTLVTLLKKLPRPGIVYAATVKKVEELYESLSRHGIPVERYHGRMNKGERDTAQNRFMASHELIMIATNAFGLGVDKPDIRNVLHYHVPGSLEAYAQEAGRGGRDGKPARCVLLFSPDDVAIQEYFLQGTYPTKRQVWQVYEALKAFSKLSGKDAEDSLPTLTNLALGSSVGQQRTRTVLSLLKDEHFITEKEGGLYYVAEPPPAPGELMERARQYEARRIADRQRLDALLAYVKAPGCRSQAILEYLGEIDPPKCGRCDNCLRSREAALAASTQATRLGASLTRLLDDDAPDVKPKKEIKARVVRIDGPKEGSPAAAGAPVLPPKPAGPTVLRRAGASSAAAVQPAPALVVAAPVAAPPSLPPAPKPVPAAGEEGDEDDDDLDDEDEDDDVDGAELEGDDDDDDDDDLDDDDDDDDDDEDDDDEDDEVIDKTAAQLAEEGIEGTGEITVLARKRVPKQPKQRTLLTTADATSDAAAEARRKRRRRRRKRRAMLPPKTAFTSPVMSTSPDGASASARRGGGGPVIEYVRGPMRIGSAPVASANPNDAGAGARGGKRTRWDRPSRVSGGGGRGGSGGGGYDRGGRGGPRVEMRGPGGGTGGSSNGNGGGQPFARGPGGGPPGEAGGGAPGEKKRRRRRRKRRDGAPGAVPDGGGVPRVAAPGGDGGIQAPVSFFSPVNGGGGNGGASTHGGAGPNGGDGADAGPIVLGPDGLPMRKRRRRRRRGRGGRQREWHGAGAPPPEGAGPSDSGGDAADAGGDDGPD